MDRDPVVHAVPMAQWGRRDMMHVNPHSNRGSLCTSYVYQASQKDHRIISRMSTVWILPLRGDPKPTLRLHSLGLSGEYGLS